uniref:non-specific serine/threonine protein kinase n=1 Tax=Eutreptiella gymnastica TaxID=73025 RepID=A0A7S1NGA1_9EUGL|mmetsp:Transcript_26940/g.48460  ORF Transcript_26940/g.48460 Transcript_26940/m.48460 type:complete len:443 (+) Transcript_26940:57-1385(+)
MNPAKWFSKKIGGEYELGKTLGKGHFSKVKLGIHIQTKKQVAVKIMERKALVEEQMEEQLKREIAIMRKLDHPHVTKMFEVLQTQKHVYLVLELVTGGELFDKIVQKKRFDETMARNYFQQLVVGTYYCHLNDVAHRDLKPENLLLDDKGILKISDFGLSNLQPNSGSGQMGAGQQLYTMCGTPEYVAPEVLRDQGYNGFIADVWSCGVILYVMLAGSLPFRDTEKSTVFQKIKAAQYEMKPFFPEGAQDLIRKLLVVDPAKRWTLEQVAEHEWFKPGFDTEAWLELRGQSKLSVNADEIRTAVIEFTPAEPVQDDVPATLCSEGVEDPKSLARHTSFKNVSFVEKPSNTMFLLKLKPELAVAMVTGVLTQLGANPEIKKTFTVKCMVETDRTVTTFLIMVNADSKNLANSIVEVRRGRGSILDFHDIYRSMLERLGDVLGN